jgi:hypothetical protein
MANLIFSILSEYNGKGLAKGKKDVTSFEKSLKKLGRTLGLTFSAAALINFSKNAVKAFAADEKAAKSLEIQLKNTGYAFSAPGVEYYIANLQKATGVLDDQLRPALQTLLTASGSLTQSQKALAVALDVSAATGKSVVEVSAAMAKGFSGQTTALTRLGAGLSKATLASGDMNKILDELSRKFSGQAAARLDTYAGKMDLLKVASENAKEEIGKGLIDALSLLGDNKDIASATKQMDAFAKSTSDATIGAGVLLSTLKGLKDIPGIGPILKLIYSQTIPGLLGTLGRQEQAKSKSNFTYELGPSAGADIARAKEATAIKNAAKLRAQENAALKAKAALQGLIDKYDVERIGLMAALNFATDEETKARIADKLAILDGNAAMAAKYLAERNAEQGLEELAAATDDAVKALDKLKGWDPLSGLKVTEADKINSKSLADLGGVLGGLLGGLSGKSAKPIDNTISIINGKENPNFFMPPATTPYDPLSSLMATMADISSAGAYNPLSGLRVTPQEAMEIKVTIDAGGDRMSQAIAESIQVATRSGYSTTPAGFLS